MRLLYNKHCNFVIETHMYQAILGQVNKNFGADCQMEQKKNRVTVSSGDAGQLMDSANLFLKVLYKLKIDDVSYTSLSALWAFTRNIKHWQNPTFDSFIKVYKSP